MCSAWGCSAMTRSGLPHSGIPGLAYKAAHRGLSQPSYALHRLLAPRHPPRALSSLTSINPQTKSKTPGLSARLQHRCSLVNVQPGRQLHPGGSAVMTDGLLYRPAPPLSRRRLATLRSGAPFYLPASRSARDWLATRMRSRTGSPSSPSRKRGWAESSMRTGRNSAPTSRSS